MSFIKCTVNINYKKAITVTLDNFQNVIHKIERRQSGAPPSRLIGTKFVAFLR